MSTTTDQNSPTAYLEHRPVLGRRQGRLLGIAGPLCMAILGAWLAGGGWTQRFEGITIDWRFRARGPRQPPANVVIVEIDEESRRNLRPDGVAFSLREQLTPAIDNLAEAGAVAIGLDFWFEDPGPPEVDQRLAETLSRTNVVLAVTHTDGRLKRAPDVFLASGPQEGVITVYPDQGNVLRRLPERLYLDLLGQSGSPTDILRLPHFPLALAWYAAIQTNQQAQITFDRQGVGHIGQFVVRPRELIDFATTRHGPGAGEPRWRTLRFDDVVRRQFDAAEVDGAIVLIGESRAIQDSFVMPLSDEFVPGVYYHANSLAHILQGRGFQATWAAGTRQWGLTAALALAAGLFAWNQRQWWHYRHSTLLLLGYLLIGVTAFLGGWTLLAFVLFGREVLLPVVAPLTAMGTALASGLAAQWVILSANARRLEQRSRHIEALFGQSVSQSILEALKRNPDSIRQTQTREVSVLFCDLRNFTAQASEMQPAEVAAMLNEYYNYITTAVFENDGFIDKFVGDEIMAVFSVPFEQPDHAVRAVRTAISLKRRLAELNRVRQSRGQSPLECGLGIHCGPAAAGHIGSRERSNYTVVGTTVNLAARIQHFTKHGEILLSSAVQQRLPADIDARLWDQVEIRGAAGRHELYVVDVNDGVRHDS